MKQPRRVELAFRYVEEAQPPVRREGRRLVVCKACDIAPGSRRIIEAENVSIGVFNVAGKFHAVKNVCPHQGAALCRGTVEATHRPGDVQQFTVALCDRVLRCPWHGWEFDIVTGQSLHDPDVRVATYATEVNEQGDLIVLL